MWGCEDERDIKGNCSEGEERFLKNASPIERWSGI